MNHIDLEDFFTQEVTSSWDTCDEHGRFNLWEKE